MEKRNQPNIKKNLLYRIAFEILNVVLPIITAPYIARVLGAENIGIYSFSHSIVTYFMLFAALGTVGYGTREIARCRDNKNIISILFWEIELLTILTSAVCLLCWIVLSFVSEEYRPYFIALTPMLLGTAFDISWFYTGIEEVKYTVTVNFVFKLASVISIFMLVKAQNDLIIYFLINALAILLGNVSSWLFLPKFLCKVNKSSIHVLLHLRKTIVYFVPTIAISIYTTLDKTLIGLLTDSKVENGYYEQADKIIRIVKSVSFSAVNNVLGARQSYLFAKDDKKEIQNHFFRTTSLLIAFEVGCVFGLISVSDQFIPLFFGDGYEPVIGLLNLMSPLLVIIAVSNTIGAQILTPSGRIKTSTVILSIGSAVNFACNCILIPVLGAAGAVIGSIVAEGIITTLFVLYSRKDVSVKKLLMLFPKRIIAGMIMFFFLKCFDVTLAAPVLGLILKCVIGIIVYLGILIILKDKDIVSSIRDMVLKIINKRKK